jgi:hypothetical protein
LAGAGNAAALDIIIRRGASLGPGKEVYHRQRPYSVHERKKHSFQRSSSRDVATTERPSLPKTTIG